MGVVAPGEKKIHKKPKQPNWYIRRVFPFFLQFNLSTQIARSALANFPFTLKIV